MVEGISRSTQEEARKLLADCTLFRGLNADQRKILVARARVRAFSTGDVIFLMGSPGDSMMAVLNGNVRISAASSEGKEIVLAIMHPGDVFGEIALLDGKGRTADAKAMTACNLAILERRDVLSFFEHHPGARRASFKYFANGYASPLNNLPRWLFLDLPMRLAKTLLRMAPVGLTASGGRSTPKIHLSQRELGNIVGATRESVNKCLREWQHSGMIKIEDNLITIKNRPALKTLAELD